jgi:carbon monoxide dehydrogenase subunit G
VLEVEAPTRLRARAGGRDAAVDGIVKVDLSVSLAPAGDGTTLRLLVDINVLGKLGTLGHSVIVRKGTDIVDRFAAAVRAQLEAPA